MLIIDPATNTTYVLVRADVYEQMLGGKGEFDPRDTYPFVEQVMREDDDHDPLLAGYQRPASAATTR